jgi:hypothetical protein
MSVPAADNLRHLDMAPTEAVYDEWLTAAADLLEAIDALHHPHTAYGETFCCHCAATDWPCATYRLLHPEVQP